MKCGDQGRLLLYLDNELSPEEMQATKDHLDSCPRCSLCLEKLEDNLNFTRKNIGLLWREAGKSDVLGGEKVWKEITSRIIFKKKGMNWMKIRKITAAAAIVLALGLVVSVPSVRIAAANFLQVFRVEKVDSITLSIQDMNQIQEALNQGGSFNVEDFGKISTHGSYERVSLKEEQVAELPFEAVFPAGLTAKGSGYYLEKQPALQISPDVEKVNQLIKDLGGSELLPQELQGQTVIVKMGDFLSTQYDDFTLIQGPSPQVEVPDGVDAQGVIRAMLSLPCWPDNVKRQLDAVDNWEHTLLIPVDENSSKVTVNGSTGVLMGNAGQKSLIWQENGLLYILEDHSSGGVDLLEIAGSLR
ncbi:MAG: zf-HC2 domain-containing protein [Syntrophomonas sp.]